MKMFILLIGIIFSGCQTSALKYQKGYLLDTTMDPNKSSSAAEMSNQEAASWTERAINETGGGFGSSCPTCGG